MSQNLPSYLNLIERDELNLRVETSFEKLKRCELCPWKCKVDRVNGQLGICQTGELARVHSYGVHKGEEKPIRGWNGSGTIFFSRCNMRCQYCQNSDISQKTSGDLVSAHDLANMMLELQAKGCHNINFVTPSHVVPQLLAAVNLAAQAGLRIPLIYNTGGYDLVETLKLLDGVVDIYMPDMKYGSSQIALNYSKVRNYVQINQAAVREMYQQVGDLSINEEGIATKGLLIRHLVLPNNLAGTEEVIRFIAKEISINTQLNIMKQYTPSYNASQYPKLKRIITALEYNTAINIALQAGLTHLVL